MHTSPRLLAAVISVVFWLVISAKPVAACSGGDAPLASGIRGATAIFYARIVAAGEAVGFYDLQLEIGPVVRGPATSHIAGVITPRACDQLSVGDSGLVVLGSVDPYGDGRGDVYNFFYVLGPGHMTAAQAADVLTALRPTDGPPPADSPDTTSTGQSELLATLALVTFAILISTLAVRLILPSRRR